MADERYCGNEIAEKLNKEELRKYKKAQTYFKNNTKPVQKLCPEIVQYWRSAQGTVYYSNVSGKRGDTLEDVMVTRVNLESNSYYNRYFAFQRTPSSYGYDGFYIRYVKALDALEFAFTYMDGSRGKDGEKRQWTFDNRSWNRERYLVYKDDTNIYGVDKVFVGRKYWNKKLIDMMGERLSDPQNREEIAKELLKFSPDMVCRDWSGKRDATPWLWEARDAYKKSFIKRNLKSAKTTEILEIELPEKRWTYNENTKTIDAYFDKVNDDWFVFRFPQLKCDYHYETSEYKYEVGDEAMRIFVPNNNKDKLVIAQRWGNGRWERTTIPADDLKILSCWHTDGTFIELIGKENLGNCVRTKYIKDLCDWSKTYGYRLFVSLFRHPICEQLCKMGHSDIANYMTRNSIGSILKSYFGIKERKQPLLKLLKVNKEIMKRLADMPSDDSSNRYYTTNYKLLAVRELKRMYGVDVSSLSSQTLDELSFLFSQTFYNNIGSLTDLVRGYRYYGEELLGSTGMNDETKEKILHAIRVAKKTKGNNDIDYEALNLVKDIHRMQDIALRNDIDIEDYRNKHDLEIIHDNLIEIQRIEREEQEARWNMEKAERLKDQKKKFEKLQEKRIEKYEEIGDEFAVIVPKELNDLVKEGSRLHHCVGSYVERHAYGDTNILFLRRKEELDTPFYTIEVTNGNYVVQVHGSHNKWLGNDPEAIPFLYQYFKKHGFDFNNNLLLNLGAGYGASSERLPESYLTEVA